MEAMRNLLSAGRRRHVARGIPSRTTAICCSPQSGRCGPGASRAANGTRHPHAPPPSSGLGPAAGYVAPAAPSSGSSAAATPRPSHTRCGGSCSPPHRAATAA
eukprot:5005428-Prymnesium_polylepis.1